MQHAGSTVALDRTDALDTLLARLDQISGALTAIRNTYDDRFDEYMLPPSHMRNALWAMAELLDQAREAAEKLT